MRIKVSSVFWNLGGNRVWPSQHNGCYQQKGHGEARETCPVSSSWKGYKWHGHTYQSNKWKGVRQMNKQNDRVSEAEEGHGCQSWCSEHWTLRRESSESGEEVDFLVSKNKMVSENKTLNFPFIISPFLPSVLLFLRHTRGQRYCDSKQPVVELRTAFSEEHAHRY